MSHISLRRATASGDKNKVEDDRVELANGQKLLPRKHTEVD